MVQASCLLSKTGMAVVDAGVAGDGPMEGVTTPEPALDLEIDKPVFMKENEIRAIPNPDLGVLD